MEKPAAAPAAKTPVDWTSVHERLAQASAGIASDSITRGERDRALLASRARALAKPLADAAPAASDDTLGVVRFELAGQALALDASAVRETIIPRDITPLPGLPPFVRGLVNVRSRVLPVFDLRPLLALAAGAPAASEQLLIVTWEGAEFALLADAVTSSGPLALASLRREVPGLNQKYLRGLAADGTLLLDLATLFPDLRVAEDSL